MLLALFALLSVADCAGPKVGDNVSICLETVCYDGKVISLSDSMICLKVYFVLDTKTGDVSLKAPDTCIGLAQIQSLQILE